jgi:S1-C subfamily serine protease
MGIGWKPGAEAPTIGHVGKDTPASRAGLEVGDTIVGIDGRDMPTIEALARELASRWTGEKAKLRVKRGRKEIDLEIEFGARPKPE